MFIYCDADGPGSFEDIKKYVKNVLDERTCINDDTTSEKLAHNIVMSIFHRLEIHRRY